MKYDKWLEASGESIRYLVVGGFTTLVNIGVYQVGLQLGLAYLLATTIAFIISVVFAFFTNKHFVFRVTTQHSTLREFVMFTGTRISTFIIETIGLIIMISGLRMQEMIAKLIINVIVILLNYFISKFWIFKGEKSEENKAS